MSRGIGPARPGWARGLGLRRRHTVWIVSRGSEVPFTDDPTSRHWLATTAAEHAAAENGALERGDVGGEHLIRYVVRDAA